MSDETEETPYESAEPTWDSPEPLKIPEKTQEAKTEDWKIPVTHDLRLQSAEPEQVFRRVLLLPDSVARSLGADKEEIAAATGMVVIQGPRELLDQIRVL